MFFLILFEVNSLFTDIDQYLLANLICLMNNNKKSILEEKHPAYCDYNCKHAAFAPEDSTGACRREQAVYCSWLENLITKIQCVW